MARTGVELDDRKARADVEKAAKRLYERAENILVDHKRPLHQRVAANAPRKTGRLRASVTTEVTRLKRGPVLKVFVRRLPYAAYVEFGTSTKRARPFMRPALAEVGGLISRIAGARGKAARRLAVTKSRGG